MAAAGAADAAAAKPLARQKVRAPAAGKLYWGAYRTNVPYARAVVRSLEQDAGRRPAVVMWYQEWSGNPPFPAADAAWLVRRGEVPMLTWEPWDPRLAGPNQPAYRLRRIARGAFDPYIRSYARQVRAYGRPLMLRPFHEMDGNWYPWGGSANGNSPSDLVAAWRHVHRVFDRAGARNVTWVWSVNGTSVPQTPENSISHYWPGARYVDWIGVSAFNFAGSLATTGGFASLATIAGPRFASLRPYHRPVMLTETASVEGGGDKAAWIRAMPGDLLGAPVRVGGFVWYDRQENSAQDFPFTSSAASRSAFRGTVAGRHVLSAPSALPRR